MSITPTSYHAFNLFHLTMETRFGAAWRKTVAPDRVAVHADEIALGFGGLAQGLAHTQSGNAAPTLWRFPDGSLTRAGHFGLEMADCEEVVSLRAAG